MGRSITIHVEIRVRGKWLHYDMVPLLRGSDVFEQMIQKSGGYEDPRGLPVDATETTVWDNGKDQESGASWLTAEEAASIERWWRDNSIQNEPRPLFGDHVVEFIHFVENPSSRWEGLEDARVVFWFDQ